MTPAKLHTLVTPIYSLWPPTLAYHTHKREDGRYTLSWHYQSLPISTDLATSLLIAHAAPRIEHAAGCLIGTSKLNVFDLLTCLVRTFTLHKGPTHV